MQCLHGCGTSTLATRLSLAPVFGRHSVICIAANDILNETRQRKIGLAHIAISDLSVEGGSSSWYHIADGGVRDG